MLSFHLDFITSCSSRKTHPLNLIKQETFPSYSAIIEIMIATGMPKISMRIFK